MFSHQDQNANGTVRESHLFLISISQNILQLPGTFGTLVFTHPAFPDDLQVGDVVVAFQDEALQAADVAVVDQAGHVLVNEGHVARFAQLQAVVAGRSTVPIIVAVKMTRRRRSAATFFL